MIRNYLRIAFRNLRKNKVFSAINILGLAIGMAACIIIFLFVRYEKGFDSIHKKRLYRLDEVQKFEGMVAPQNVALSMFPMGPTLKSDFPEVMNFTRLRSARNIILTYNDKKVEFKEALWVDSTFLQLFDFPVQSGERLQALMKPNSAVLTASGAKKIFGAENPIGKLISRYDDDTLNFTVTAVLADPPANSHLQFEALFSLSTVFGPDAMQNWGGNGMVTYLELSPNANVANLEKKFPAYLKKYMAEGEGWKFYTLYLQSLADVHSGSTNITHDYLNYRKFDKTYTYIFSVIGIVILLIACINFMNLSTARSAERAKEVGIRKSIGADRKQLAFQFLGESVLLTLISLVLAIAFAWLCLPYVNRLSERELELSFLGSNSYILFFLGGAVLVGLISGIYPALYLSSFQPIKVLKGLISVGNNKSVFRNVLVVGQFTGAIFLIIATLFAIKQLRFMQEKNPGFNKDQVVVVPLDSKANKNYDALKKQLAASSSITGITASRQRLGNNLHQSGFVFHGEGPARELASSQVVVDPDYLKVYKIEMLAGRDFSTDASDNAKTYIINETMAHELLKDTPNKPLESLLGRNFGFGGMDSAGTIVGVCKDFNFNSLHHKIETLSIFNQKDWGFGEMSIRVNGANAKAALAAIKAAWKDVTPASPFEYTFLDEHFADLYRADTQVSEVVGVLATLAIIISCLGLFGLASYSAEKRIKEIGIRKVLGASVQNIIFKLSSSFIKLVLISIVIAIPLAYLAIHKWLQDFAYRIETAWWVFAAAGLVAILIALVTVSFQAIKAALANPVKSLRSE
jgi:putative ABC transport system permease protein